MLRGILCIAFALSALTGFESCTTMSNRSPKINSAPGTAASVGQPYRHDVGATEPDAGDTLAYSLSAAPGGIGINPGKGFIAWTPSAAGTAVVTIEVSDGKGGFDRQPFSVTVTAATQLP